jgi:hypothetical protein
LRNCSSPPSTSKPNSQKEDPTPLTESRLEELLVDQSRAILNAVGEKLAAQNVAILSAVDKRLEQMEKRFNEKLDLLTNTLDRFLKHHEK